MTRREEDERYAFVELTVDLDLVLEPAQPQDERVNGREVASPV